MSDNQQEEYAVMIAKKSERLVTALYIVTDLIDGNEPIKNSLRKNAVVLLSSMNALMQYDVKDRTTEFASSLKSVMEILSLLHVASATSLVSEMNGSLLITGFRTLQSVLERKRPVLTKEMISVDEEETLYQHAETFHGIPTTSYDALTLGQVHAHNSRPVEKDEIKKDIPSRVLYKGQNEAKPQDVRNVLMQHVTRPTPSLASSFQARKQGRREQILALFVKGVDVSIKDIAARIKGCSEKTIQRELNALVYDNVIERIGEKRWSRYILK